MNKLLLAAVLLTACGSMQVPVDTGQADAGQADAGPPPGTPGAHVWSASSVSAQVVVTTAWYDFTTGHSGSSKACKTIDRTSASQAELDTLTNLTLIPVAMNCTYDGSITTVLSVFDADGGAAVYSDTGCVYGAIPDAGAMLPPVSFGATSPCQ